MKTSSLSTAAPQERQMFFHIWVHILLPALIFGALIFTTTRAPAQEVTPPPPQSQMVRPDDLGFGGLLLNALTPGFFVEAPLLATDVTIDVTGPIARTKITQRFQNPSDGWVEGKYVFPLPDEAAVDTLRMQIGDRFIEGQIKERQEAKIIYEEAKAQGFKASLVEQERPNLFTNSVANIGPGEVVIVQIEYQEHVKLDNGEFSLRFPMVVAPRYTPPAQVQIMTVNGQGWGTLDEQVPIAATVEDPVPDRDRISPTYLRPDEDPNAPAINPVTLTINLTAGFDLAEVTSAHHKIVTRKTRDGAMTIALADGEVAANRDFELTWEAEPGQEPQAALFTENRNGEDYVLALVVPPIADAGTTPVRKPREAIFVLDNSGSMGGESIRQAKASLLMALDQLQPEDRFNVIRFDDTYDLVFSTPVAATPVNIATAKGFVSSLDAEGGTQMLPALEAALADMNLGDTDRLRQVIFLTDGAIGNEAQMFETIRRDLGRSRLFTVGIGSAPNSYFMSRAARLGRGTFTHIGDLNQVQARMAVLFDKLENPVMTDLVAEWPVGVAGEAWPNPLPDLYAGEPVVLTARLSKMDGTLRLAGNLNGEAWLAELPLSKAAPGSGVSKLWARKKIASIEESRYDGASWQDVDKGVLMVALEHHLVSRLTSLVAVDVTPSRPVGETLTTKDVPLNLPDGWDFDKVFGGDTDPAPVDMRDADSGLIQLAALAVADTPGDLPSAKPSAGLQLPQGATQAELQMILGGLMILSALTLLAWRRRAGAIA